MLGNALPTQMMTSWLRYGSTYLLGLVWFRMPSQRGFQVINKQSDQQGGAVKQQTSEQQRKQNNIKQQQQHDGQQAAAGGSQLPADQQQPVNSTKASGSNCEVRVLEGYSSKDMAASSNVYVNKDASTYSKDLLDLCTSVTPPPSSQPSTTTATTMVQVTNAISTPMQWILKCDTRSVATNSMLQVSSHSRRPRGDRDSQTFPEFDPTRWQWSRNAMLQDCKNQSRK